MSPKRLAESGNRHTQGSLRPLVQSPSEAREESQNRQLIVDAASRILASRPLSEVSLHLIADYSGLALTDVQAIFPNIRDIGVAILEAEGASMRIAQETASEAASNPIEALRLTFRLVGRNMATEPVVRAGMRMAVESRQHFPERSMDPFRTWRFFIHSQLLAAQDRDLLRPEVDLDQLTWLLVSAGLGSKELVSFRDEWAEIGLRLESVLDTVLRLALRDSSAALSESLNEHAASANEGRAALISTPRVPES